VWRRGVGEGMSVEERCGRRNECGEEMFNKKECREEMWSSRECGGKGWEKEGVWFRNLE
jgi:hypothetical protein